MGKLCIYCQKEKPLEQFSLEHILPEGLVGTNAPELFKTDNVCRDCNSTCGLFVDGPFLKNWFIKNGHALDALYYYEFEKKGPLPLVYMGRLAALETDLDEVCEVWLGPCGESIYHFHKKSEERFSAYAGGNPIELKKDGGKAFIFFTSINPDWLIIALNSFLKHFANAQRYTGTGFADKNILNCYFHSASVVENEIIKRIWDFKANNSFQKGELSIQLTFELRFLAKVALAIGANIFGNDYLGLPYALELKKALWTKKPKDFDQINILGAGFFGKRDEHLNGILGWEGAIVIHIQAVGKFLGLTLNIYGSHSLSIAITNELDRNEKDYSRLYEGEIYIAIPILNIVKGAIPLPQYIAHKQHNDYVHPELKQLELLKRDISKLPPK